MKITSDNFKQGDFIPEALAWGRIGEDGSTVRSTNSQFTLAADTMSGNRPSFSRAAPPEEGLAAFNAFVTALRGEGLSCPTGEFGAHMRVSLVNDGPATFSLHLRADGAGAD